MKRLEGFVTNLAEWSCSQVRNEIMKRGDAKEWVASFDGFYLTRGHYSNNSSATLHDHSTGKVAWFTHRTKRGQGHNWTGTSAGAEPDMLEEVLESLAFQKKLGVNIEQTASAGMSTPIEMKQNAFQIGPKFYVINKCIQYMILFITSARTWKPSTVFVVMHGLTHSPGDNRTFLPEDFGSQPLGTYR